MVVEILVECPDEELDKNEIECIELYRTLAPEGYNCTTEEAKLRKNSLCFERILLNQIQKMSEKRIKSGLFDRG